MPAPSPTPRRLDDAPGLTLPVSSTDDLILVRSALARKVAVSDLLAWILTQVQGDELQAHAAILDAVAALSATGLMVRTGAGAAAARSVLGTSGQIGVTNQDGAAGNISLALLGNALALSGLSGAALKVPVFTGSAAMGLRDFDDGSVSVTPTLSFSTPGDLSVSYTTQTARRLKIGRLVIYFGTMRATPTYTTAAGNVTVSLPFTAESAGEVMFGSVRWISTPTWPAATTMALATVTAGAGVFLLQGSASGVTVTSFGATEFPSGVSRWFNFFLVYIASS